MAERSFPFDIDPDTLDPQTTYEEDFSTLLEVAVGDGAYAAGLNASLVGTNVVISSGRAICRGYGYVNTSDLIIPVPLNAHSSLFRSDRIFLRLDKTGTNKVNMHYVQGTPGAHNPNGTEAFFTNPAPTGPVPSQTANVWDTFMFLVVVPPQNSPAIQVFDEKQQNIPGLTQQVTGRHAAAYNNSFRNGVLSFSTEAPTTFLPRFKGVIDGKGSDILAEGPNRLFHKSSDQTLIGDNTWRAITGWNTIDQEFQPFGNQYVTLADQGVRLGKTGFWEIYATIRVSGGAQGARSVRIRNHTANETWGQTDGAVSTAIAGYGHTRTVRVRRRFFQNDLVRIEYLASGGSNGIISGDVRTQLHVRYISGGH